MVFINLSQQTTEWVEKAIIANGEEYERLTCALNDEILP